MLVGVYIATARLDNLPPPVQALLRQWLGSKNERHATTSKFLAYHLEVWFSNNRCCPCRPYSRHTTEFIMQGCTFTTSLPVHFDYCTADIWYVLA